MEQIEIETEQLLAALKYGERGWPVFPIHTPLDDGTCSCNRVDCSSIGKHPQTLNGFKDATTDETQIRKWWTWWPNANIGIATGEPSGLVVLDVDPRHGGSKSYAELEQEHGPLPKTLVSLTGGGGKHIFFEHPGRRIKSASNVLGPGLDIRADGGYIVAPPSRHASGKIYRWEVASDER